MQQTTLQAIIMILFALQLVKMTMKRQKKMIAYGANVNDRYNGITPLMYAARYNNVEMLKELLNNGADLSLKDSRGNTALKFAELSNAKEAIEFLKSVKK